MSDLTFMVLALIGLLSIGVITLFVELLTIRRTVRSLEQDLALMQQVNASLSSRLRAIEQVMRWV